MTEHAAQEMTGDPMVPSCQDLEGGRKAGEYFRPGCKKKKGFGRKG